MWDNLLLEQESRAHDPAPEDMQVRLKGPRVVVRADLPGEKIGMIIVPDIAKSQPLSGEVVLVGEGVTEVTTGERVLFPSSAWSRFNAPGYGFPFMLLWSKDLIAVLE